MAGGVGLDAAGPDVDELVECGDGDGFDACPELLRSLCDLSDEL